MESSGATGLLYSFPSPPTPGRTRQPGNSPAPKGSHRTPLKDTDTRSEGPTPPILCAPPRTLTTPSPPNPLVADKARSPGPRPEGEGIRTLPNSLHGSQV